jgi:hypothetical protein
MPAKMKSDRDGLCSSCINALTCVYRTARGFDAIYCEMFDNGVRPFAAEDSCKGAEPASILEGLGEGLCVNCANREMCALPRPDGGVWHCEEYC